MDRRKFTKITLAASGAIALPGFFPIANNWPKNNLGGGENLFLNEQDFTRIRENVDQFDWAKKRFEVLRTNAFMSEDEFYQSHWQSNWRQWTTGQYLKYVALYNRLSGEEKNLSQIKLHLTQEFNLDKIDKPLYDPQKAVSSEMWLYGMTRMNYFWAWDMVKNHSVLSSIKDPMMQRLNEIIHQYFRYENENITRLGNTQFWSITTLGILGFLTSNEEAIEHAINGTYGLKTVLENKLRDGKFWPEPLGYALDYVLCSMSLLAEASKRNNYDDLYNYVSPTGASIKSLIDGLFDLCNPNGLLVASGDGSYCAELYENGKLRLFNGFGAYLFNGKQTRIGNKFEIFYSAYKDPKYAWLINKTEDRFCVDVTVWGDNTLTHGIPLGTAETPSFTSTKYQGIGHALISTVEGKEYWEGKGNVLHIRNGNTNQYHGHDDPFHIDLYVNGKMIYPDWYLKSWDYLAPRASNGNRNKTPISHYSLGHNTVLVDKKGPDYRRYQLEQKNKEVNDIIFSEIQKSGRMKTISLEGSIYKGVKQKRILGLTSDYLIDIFECESDAVHTYDYLLHDEGELIVEIPNPMQEYDGFTIDYQLEPIDSASKLADNQWLRKGFKGSVDQAWEASFGTASEKRSVLHVGAEKETEVFTTNTPLYSSSGWDNTPEDIRKMSKPMLIIRRKCKATKFVVVHQLTSLDKKYEVKANKNSIEISTEDYSDTIEIKGENIIHKSRQ
jgi:hypothetical protein